MNGYILKTTVEALKTLKGEKATGDSVRSHLYEAYRSQRMMNGVKVIQKIGMLRSAIPE